MTARRRRHQPATPTQTLAGRLGVQAMLFLAFALNVFLAAQFHRGAIEILIAVFGIGIAVLGAVDVIRDHQHSRRMRVQLSYEATRADWAEHELTRMRRYLTQPGGHR